MSTVIGPTGAEYRTIAHNVLLNALTKIGLALENLSYVVATGYGRMSVPFAELILAARTARLLSSMSRVE